MADTKREEEKFDLSEVDTGHLARQALQLFRKRYSALYDSLMAFDTKGVGYVTYEEFHRILSGLADAELGQDDRKGQEESKKNLELTWFCVTGGHTGEEVPQFDRNQLIELCIRGYHSKDENHINLLVDAVTYTSRRNFDFMDTNQDGFISHEEFAAWVDRIGDREKWKEAFPAMDLNCDGMISRDEFLKCALGCFFHIDEERYNHFFGVIKD